MNSGYSSKSLSLWDRMLEARACTLEQTSLRQWPVRVRHDERPSVSPCRNTALLGQGLTRHGTLPPDYPRCCGHRTREWKKALAQVISEIGPSVPTALPDVQAVLQDPDPLVRLHGIYALDGFPKNPDATDLMVGAMSDPDVKVRRKAASVFDHVGYDPSGKYLDLVIASIRDTAKSTDKEGIAALAGYGPRSVPAMIEFIDHPLVSVRLAVISNLGGYGRVDGPPAGVIDALRGALADLDPTVRNAAVRALGQWGAEARSAASPVLALCGESNQAILVRCSALLTIGRIGGNADEAVPVLVRALDDADSSVRRQCASQSWLRLFGPAAACGRSNAFEVHTALTQTRMSGAEAVI